MFVFLALELVFCPQVDTAGITHSLILKQETLTMQLAVSTNKCEGLVYTYEYVPGLSITERLTELLVQDRVLHF